MNEKKQTRLYLLYITVLKRKKIFATILYLRLWSLSSSGHVLELPEG